MNRYTTLWTACMAVVLGTGSLFLAAGCTNQTEGEQTLERAERMEDAGAMIRRGEMHIADGKALVARGEEVKRQGDHDRGDRLIAEGQARIRLGEEQISQGRRLRDNP